MASKDNIYDLLDRLKNDNMDYLLITVDKNSDADKVELFYEAETLRSEQCMVYGFQKLVEQIQEGGSSDDEVKEVDYGFISPEDLDEFQPPLNGKDDNDEEEV